MQSGPRNKSESVMPTTPSRASVFLQKVENLGPAAAYDYIANLAKKSAQTDENEWREFKGGGFLSGLTASSIQKRQDTDRKLKEIWSECLGAFANSAAVDPPTLGVQIVALTAKGSPSGFVVCYIPQRSGDGFYHLQMSVDLRNRGIASGEDIAIHFVPINQQSRPFYDSNRWTLEVRSDGFYFRGQTTVHPGDRLPWLSNCTSDVRDWTEPGRPLLFRFRIFARNTPAHTFLVSFSSAELGAQPGVAIKREAVSEE